LIYRNKITTVHLKSKLFSSSAANEKYTRNRMRMRQIAFCTHFTGSCAAPQAKSLPMISCMRKGKFGWVNDKFGGKRRLLLAPDNSY
jgi:hypothetical protein